MLGVAGDEACAPADAEAMLRSCKPSPTNTAPASGDQPQLQPQPAGRLATAKPGERAGQRDAQADAGVDPGAQLRGLPPGQFGQAPAARADQRPGTEDAGGGAQHGTDEGRRLTAGPRRGQRRQRNAEQGQPQAAPRVAGEPGGGQGTDEVAAVVGRRPFSAGGGAQGAVAHHQRHQRREGEPADAHGDGEGDDAAADDEPCRAVRVGGRKCVPCSSCRSARTPRHYPSEAALNTEFSGHTILQMRTMDLDDLHIFRCVVREGGVTRAANRLHRVPSNVTTRIKQFEERLGVSLFRRQGRGLALTDAGRTLLGHAERLLQMADLAEQELRSGVVRGVLRLGSLESAAGARLPPVLSAFHAQYPDVSIELQTGTTARSSACWSASRSRPPSCRSPSRREASRRCPPSTRSWC